jgi:hypothetical protein
VTTIHVVLINAATQQVFGEVELPAERLPETFAVATTLHLGDADWNVEHAEPATRAEYVVARRLRLVIREIKRVDPMTILFSLPTIENMLPPMQDGNGDAVRLHEDDWRQLELVTAELEPAIEAELAAIREIHAERDGVGFRRLHVRERIPDPLAGADIKLDAVRRGRRRDVGFEGRAGIVVGGFAFDDGDGAIYGREDGGRVVVLGAWRTEPGTLIDLAREHRLVIVHWCTARMSRP